jgi:predicted transcriptional regulator
MIRQGMEDRQVGWRFAAIRVPAALFRVLTAKRWELIERLQTTGPTTLRGLARELDRDVKRVHEDVSVLIKHGLVIRTTDRKIACLAMLFMPISICAP